MAQHGVAIALKHVLHGGIALLHTNIRRFPALIEQVRQKRGQQHGNILPDEGEDHGLPPKIGIHETAHAARLPHEEDTRRAPMAEGIRRG